MEPPRRHRVFADANVLIRGITFPRYPYEVLRLAARHEIVVVLSPSVIDDARRFIGLLFPQHLPKFDGFLATALIEKVSDPAPEEVAAHHDLVRDVKDVPVVLAAAKAQVDFLVSTDADLTDVDDSTKKLRRMIAPGRVIKPGAFLNEIIGWDHAALDTISRRQWEEIEGDVWGRSSEQQDAGGSG